ncbi:type II toxin-antitoxin system Phd/YefM family antitoxin [Levilactobacillus parabrevis]|uniref:type II toxin-antitoxin system Phd/YefM family antitoxin n=1 Tax=Levilactobacillus parabrevis TaxID=357278 RepID=UPI0021A741EF|nr:type II toxin-antitoxin system Phd/YefM family antitoxin [Levilactobacillus parabrevis]
MKVITYRNFCKNPKHYLDQVTEGFEPVTITRKSHQNAVLMSAEAYYNMRENQYVLENSANRDWLQESLNQAHQGQTIQHDLL